MKESADPVGSPQTVEAVETLLDNYTRLWDEGRKKSAWAVFDSHRITNFLMAAIDDFVVAVDGSGILGADKKATVLLATCKLYDYIIRESMPVWMVPFAGVIRQYIIYVLVSNAIDWIVSKYVDGGWKKRDFRPWEIKKTPCRIRRSK